MKITDASISLGSRHILAKHYEQADFFTLLTGNREMFSRNFQDNKSLLREIDGNQTILSIKDENILASHSNFRFQPAQSLLTDLEQQKLQIIERILFLLTGKKIKFWMAQNGTPSLTLKPNQEETQRFLSGLNRGFFYERKRLYEEHESLTFAAKGIIKTSDGRKIDINTQVNLSREFAVRNDVTSKLADSFFDPLVINFGGTAASLTSNKFNFDLDVDGVSEQISFVGSGSGFLALDLNNDDKINDGSELFGPVSQNGFADLSKYDKDDNGWIDENDSIYNRLRIWTKDDTGADSLFALGKKGIGAIYLGNVNAKFSLKDQENHTLGQAQKMGLFVKEDGQVGTLQQIDLVV